MLHLRFYPRKMKEVSRWKGTILERTIVFQPSLFRGYVSLHRWEAKHWSRSWNPEVRPCMRVFPLKYHRMDELWHVSLETRACVNKKMGSATPILSHSHNFNESCTYWPSCYPSQICCVFRDYQGKYIPTMTWISNGRLILSVPSFSSTSDVWMLSSLPMPL